MFCLSSLERKFLEAKIRVNFRSGRESMAKNLGQREKFFYRSEKKSKAAINIKKKLGTEKHSRATRGNLRKPHVPPSRPIPARNDETEQQDALKTVMSLFTQSLAISLESK